MPGEVKTTLIVRFGEAASGSGSGHLSAEVDGRADGLNNGKTSFAPGDAVHFLVYHSANVRITDVIASAGSIFQGPSQNVKQTEFVTFENERTGNLNKPASGALKVTWYGRSLGGVSLGDDQVTLTASQPGVAVAKMEYTALARSYRLSSPLELNGEKEFEVAIIIIGEAS